MSTKWGGFISHTVGFGGGAPPSLVNLAYGGGKPEPDFYHVAGEGELGEVFGGIAEAVGVTAFD